MTESTNAAEPGAAERKRAYDEWHSGLAAREGPRSVSADALWHRLVRARLGPIEGLRVAEIGCGRGDFSITLARLGAEVTGLDLSSSAVAVARERAEESATRATFVVGDAEDTGLPSESFDLVVSCECLEHVPDPARMARELFRICKPGGRCLLTTPSYLNARVLAWIVSWLRREAYNSGAGVQPYESFFLWFRVARMLRRAGFTVEAMESRVFQFLLLPRVDPRKLYVVEFRRLWLNRLFRPFGLHFFYELRRPPR